MIYVLLTNDFGRMLMERFLGNGKQGQVLYKKTSKRFLKMSKQNFVNPKIATAEFYPLFNERLKQVNLTK